MKAIIRWPSGETVIEGAALGDPRVADELDRLAKAGVSSGVTLAFEAESDRRAEFDRRVLESIHRDKYGPAPQE